MSQNASKIPLIRRPWFAFLSSMRFAVALLSVLAIASVIGTVLQQNQPEQDYVIKFGPFWAQIFRSLGLYDVYASSWFVVIMLFLVLSTSLCLWRNVPPFLREMASFRTKATAKSLQHMKHNAEISGSLRPEIAVRYLNVGGFKTKTVTREDGSLLVAAKKGAMNKWGYILAHAAIIVICLGGLADSNLLLKIGMLTGKIEPDQNSMFANQFKPQSILGEGNLSYRGNVEVAEGQQTDAAFINADRGLLLQKLPFIIELKKFHIDFYDTGMPKDFASDIVVTDKASGKKSEHTIRVNHPLTIDGVTVYQASYGDGGSKLKFRTWNLGGVGEAAQMDAVSQSQYPLDLGAAGKYRIEFGALRVYNVENLNADSKRQDGLQHKLNEVRSVNQDKKFTNVGPTITFKIRGADGQAREYINYMLPLQREGAYFYATGERASLDSDYRWLMLPADTQGKPDSFMALRELLLTAELRRQVVEKAVAGVQPQMREQFKLAVENLLAQFARGGYVAIDQHIDQTVPKADQEQTRRLMYQILVGAMDTALSEALTAKGLPEMEAGEERSRFIFNSMDAYTGLTRFQAPVLLQMNGFSEVNMSGMQVSKAPGAVLVYIGSLLLILGIFFMFYVRDKRAWLLFDGKRTLFAMSSSRSERDLQREFPDHCRKLQQLAADLERPS